MTTEQKQKLLGTGVQAVLITDPYNMRYLSGFRGGEGILYISENQNVLITDSRYTEAAGKESDFTVIEENQEHKRSQILSECISRDEARVVGFEDLSMLYCEYASLKEALSMVEEWKPLGSVVNALRAIKTEEEISYLRRAEEIGDIAFTKILEVIRPGITELEIAAELEYQMKKAGAENLGFETIVASGIHSSMPHAIPDTKKVELGDFVTMDYGCKYQGYCSDMTRTIVVGKANEKQKEIYNTVLKAQVAAEKAIRSGIEGWTVDKVARDIIGEAGYGKCFGHGLGHGVGLFIHEEPRFGKNILEPNIVITVEPGIYVPGFGGVRIEDMGVIRENCFESFAHSPKELIEL
ncbi:MAG: Xaa-Pro peptidase family protein [Fusicatenibacter sp.]|nr:Xaa-Pro peptidase family protein [Lachnospiraceae bacterium]MDY2937839.1 Xaa-Pro peptidase family protein [Fusicatenibacter sp.]